jgi:hypothetical protein
MARLKARRFASRAALENAQHDHWDTSQLNREMNILSICVPIVIIGGPVVLWSIYAYVCRTLG